MSTLAQKKRRSMILLRALSFNLTRSSELLDIKQCGDILYSMAVLNFADDNLLRRVCIDVYKGINENLRKSSVLGSILTSLGILKYKDNGKCSNIIPWPDMLALNVLADFFRFLSMLYLFYRHIRSIFAVDHATHGYM